MIKLPDERAKCLDEFLSEYLPQQPYYIEIFNKGWNACIAEVQHINATARPVSDGWVKCSDRMPDSDDFVYIWPRPDFGVEVHVAQYGKFDKRDLDWYAQVYEQNHGIEYHKVRVTHWMPLPAAP